ncbi:hypothetical protein C2S51_012439 [Perilla frutescens var. frutescens]|nr:hypothetical protein C2S51_012439 [Perilla frutescens var. frutescens]
MEEIVISSCAKGSGSSSSSSCERKIRPQKEQALNCPRCNSSNTKFCYYNNYSLSQPRYFCKTCRRYWTEGGSLRNIPVGGGSRKNKRSSSTSSSSSSKKLPDLLQNPNKDLNLGFAIHDFKSLITDIIQVPTFDKHLDTSSSSPTPPPPPSHHLSSLELLTSRSTFMADPYSSVGSGLTFPLPEFKPSSLNFSLDGLGSGYGSFQSVQETNGKLLFPFEDLKLVSNNAANDATDQNRDGYWNGVIGGGSW